MAKDPNYLIEAVELVDNRVWPLLLADLKQIRANHAENVLRAAETAPDTTVRYAAGVVAGFDLTLQHLTKLQADADAFRKHRRVHAAA